MDTNIFFLLVITSIISFLILFLILYVFKKVSTNRFVTLSLYGIIFIINSMFSIVIMLTNNFSSMFYTTVYIGLIFMNYILLYFLEDEGIFNMTPLASVLLTLVFSVIINSIFCFVAT